MINWPIALGLWQGEPQREQAVERAAPLSAAGSEKTGMRQESGILRGACTDNPSFSHKDPLPPVARTKDHIFSAFKIQTAACVSLTMELYMFVGLLQSMF